MPINAEWHRAHKMPPNAAFEVRAAWHVEHARECGCRPVPAKLAEEMREHGFDPGPAR